MTRTSFADVDCGVAQAVEQVGDKWTLVVLRSAFLGLRRFDEFRRHLDVAPNILTDRLKKLVAHGILSAEKSPSDGRVIDYRLTDKGLDLYPMVIFLNQWSERWSPKDSGARLTFRHRKTGQEFRQIQVETSDGQPVSPKDTQLVPGTGGSQVFDEAQNLVARRRLNQNL